MGRLITLKLDGNLEEQGFRVTLEVGEEQQRPQVERVGFLPGDSQLAQLIDQHWLEKYRPLGAPYGRKLKAKTIDYGGSIQEKRVACQESGQSLRDRLNQWLQSPSFLPISQELLVAFRQDQPLRFLLRTDDPHLQKLPWHLWQVLAQYCPTEPLFSPLSLTSSPPSPPQPRSKLKILVILGHREGINTDIDYDIIQSLPNVDPLFLVEPRRSAINDQLWEQSWDIIFFAGHSETERDTGTGKIYINPRESLTIDELWYGLKTAVNQGLQLAIFNSCDGLGLARRLNDLSIPQMVVMRELVPDQVAHEFLKYFLAAFSEGRRFEQAVQVARERLQGLESEFPCASWLPIVYQNPGVDSLTWDKLLRTPSVSKPPLWRWQWVGVSLLCTALVMGVRATGVLQGWEWAAYDHLLVQRPVEAGDSRLLLVGVTEGDLNQYGNPLPDDILSQVLSKLSAHQPRVMGLNIYRDQPVATGYEALVTEFKQQDNLITSCALGDEYGNEAIAPPPHSPPKQVGYNDLEWDGKHNVIRRILLERSAPIIADYSPCSSNFSFAFQIVQEYLTPQNLEFSLNSENHWQVGNLVLQPLGSHSGGYQNHDPQGYQLLINYRATPELAQSISVQQLLAGSFQPDWIRDRIVLIGVIASSSRDENQTPYGNMRSLHIQAHLVSSLISAVLDKRPLLWALPFWGDVIWVGFWSILGTGLMVYKKHYKMSQFAYGLTLSLTLGVIYGLSWGILVIGGGWLPLIPAILGYLTSGMIIALLPFPQFEK
ncbi:CHASE2 domain-containing protein [Spirulina subsalsa]|uniref:CHASE2 domain-containing protein n=1 Tax=Spirulina subsalsa TaxID=54311 RepID=UPI0002E9C64B|nr:CHASE2 domain-containing protein [Spirulina subsalsa]